MKKNTYQHLLLFGILALLGITTWGCQQALAPQLSVQAGEEKTINDAGANKQKKSEAGNEQKTQQNTLQGLGSNEICKITYQNCGHSLQASLSQIVSLIRAQNLQIMSITKGFNTAMSDFHSPGMFRFFKPKQPQVVLEGTCPQCSTQ